MSHSRWLRTALAAVLCVAWLAGSAGRAVAADPTPRNAELYCMILELEAGVSVRVGRKEAELGFKNPSETGPLIDFVHEERLDGA